MSLKFKTFLYEGNLIYFSDTIADGGRSMDANYDQNRIFCPECGVARLSFVGKYSDSNNRPHLSKDPSTPHAPLCSYNYDDASYKEVYEYYRELTDDQISAKIQSYIRRKIEPIQHREAPLANLEENLLLVPSNRNGKHTHKKIHEKSIYKIKKMDSDEQGYPIIFHGTVKLLSIENGSPYEGTYILKVFDEHGEKELWYFPRKKHHDLVDPDALYYIVAIARYESKYKISLLNNRSLGFVNINNR